MRGAILLAASVLAAVPAFANDTTDIVDTVMKYQRAYSNADFDAWTGLCTPKTVIIDNYAPNLWQGPDACAAWWKAQAALNLKNGVKNPAFAPVIPVAFQADQDHAYVVLAVQYSYTLDGKAQSFPGLWTLTLKKEAAGWRITSWTWADRGGPPAP